MKTKSAQRRKAATPATVPVAKARKKTKKSKVANAKRAKPSRASSTAAIESTATEPQPTPPPRRARSSRKVVSNESVEAVVDATTVAGEAPARTSEESVVADAQNTPEESVA